MLPKYSGKLLEIILLLKVLGNQLIWFLQLSMFVLCGCYIIMFDIISSVGLAPLNISI